MGARIDSVLAGVRAGVWLFPAAPAGRLVEAIVLAEESGLDEVWVADEGVAREPMAILAAAARETSRITMGVGITSPVLRHPGALAATASTIDELSGGRFVLGLGVGGSLSLDPFGLAVDRPVERLGEAIATARAVLAGRPDPSGRYRPPDHAAPPRPVPIWVGARGPRLVELAARKANGIFASGCAPEDLGRIARLVAGARGGGRRVDLALYQSAGASAPATHGWDEVNRVLAKGASTSAPTSVGINLVDLIDPRADPVAAVERAAVILGRG